MPIINLWSSPRNISTALMYSFAQRADTTVVDEPLYAFYLDRVKHRATHPGEADILASQSRNGREVVDRVILAGHYPTPVVVHKQMTHHLLDLDRDFLHRCRNVLLIRDPRAILASYSKVVQAPTPYDIGIPQQTELYDYLKEHDLLNAIVDAKVLLQDPRGVLERLCARLDLPFRESMLRWPAGERPEDGVWARHWYANVHASTGFQPYREKVIDLSPELEAVAQDCRAAYEALFRDEKMV